MGLFPEFGPRYFSWLARAALAEFIALGVFTFVSCSAVVSTGIVTISSGEGFAVLDNQRLLCIAFAHGIAIAICVAFSCGISGGHVNPAVTLGFLFSGRLDLVTSIVYIISQICGGVVGGGFVKAIYNPWRKDFGLGHHGLNNGVTDGKGILIEILITFILVFTVFGTAVEPKGPSAIAPLCIGLAVFMNHLVAVPLTGASMNPARTFGIAVWDDFWRAHWIYWVGPPLGGIIAGVVYNFLILYPDRPLADNANDDGKDADA